MRQGTAQQAGPSDRVIPHGSARERAGGDSSPGRISLNLRGAHTYHKVSYPLRYGIYSEIRTDQALLHFNRNLEIIRLMGRERSWPHPQEWLKRTAGNDWIYYSTGGYTGVLETTGEYYLPQFDYPTNRHIGTPPFQDARIAELIRSWPRLLEPLEDRLGEWSPEVRGFVRAVRTITPDRLARKAAELHRVNDGPVSVLPPDTRHVDYNVIPLNLSTGCLHKCRFCRVKNDKSFTEATRAEIDARLDRLAALYGADIVNYNAVFLGEHDALAADPSLLCYAAARAVERLGLGRAYMQGSHLFCFGSVTSFLAAPDALFHQLGRLATTCYINIGLESADQATLDLLGKPLLAADVIRAFERMQELNDACPTVELSANFVTGDQLPHSHDETLAHLLGQRLNRSREKGCIYLSPLEFERPSRARLFSFYRLKRLSRLPLFMYTIQRL